MQYISRISKAFLILACLFNGNNFAGYEKPFDWQLHKERCSEFSVSKRSGGYKTLGVKEIKKNRSVKSRILKSLYLAGLAGVGLASFYYLSMLIKAMPLEIFGCYTFEYSNGLRLLNNYLSYPAGYGGFLPSPLGEYVVLKCGFSFLWVWGLCWITGRIAKVVADKYGTISPAKKLSDFGIEEEIGFKKAVTEALQSIGFSMEQASQYSYGCWKVMLLSSFFLDSDIQKRLLLLYSIKFAIDFIHSEYKKYQSIQSDRKKRIDLEDC